MDEDIEELGGSDAEKNDWNMPVNESFLIDSKAKAQGLEPILEDAAQE